MDTLENLNTPQIELTPAAQLEAAAFKKNDPTLSELYLRVYIEGKGCDGFTYGVTFDSKTDEDLILMQGDVQVIIDTKTLQFMEGSVVDFVDDERGRGFIVENPNAKTFKGKFYKKKEWREKLEASR